jgi:large subunit ribosomal protein L4
MKLDVLNIQGEKTGRTIELPEDIFGIEPNEHVVYLSVKQYLANQRQGTHKSKERSELSGSTRKLHRQKGTGGSRKGDINSPTFRGGARVFGPRPRDYSQRLNKKVKVLARKSVLSDKASKGSIIVLEDFNFDQPKTKEYANLMARLGVEPGTRVLHVVNGQERELLLSSRNIPKVVMSRAQDMNTYDILNARKLILSEGTLETIVNTLA